MKSEKTAYSPPFPLRKEYRHSTGRRIHKWKICVREPFLNCEYIFPIQQKKVRQILDCLKDKPWVKKAVVFGSSIEARCHVGSDVDIYIEMDEDKNPLRDVGFDFQVDLWTNYLVDEALRKEIEKKGITVYE
ncbi:MAG: nucleotidyltransferase domain-containing protein [Lachnospiraceae bacterium]|nr:nucleotidyltransferase domain-containing protein [Lachnospiraceae bacterium]